MKKFSELGIEKETDKYIGEKIYVDKVLNVCIVIKKFKIGPSIKKPGTRLLTLQLVFKGEDRVLWTGSEILMDLISKVDPKDFPFETTIVKKDLSFDFT